MSNASNDIFYENVYEKYYNKYAEEVALQGVRPSNSDFLIWLDENNLIPDAENQDD